MGKIDSLVIQPNMYYTADEAAQLLRVSRQTIVQLLQSGIAHGIKIGRQWRVLGKALLDLSLPESQTENTVASDWFNASLSSLTEVWNNEEDAIYDRL